MLHHPFPLLLASQSPRRAQILEQAGIAFDVLRPADVSAERELEDLEAVVQGETPEHYVMRVARSKLKYHLQSLRKGAYAQFSPPEHGSVWVLCADTTVAVDGTILGKPQDAQDASKTLALLSARQHQVYTGICLGLCTLESLEPETEVWEALSATQVTFAPLSSAQIQAYVASGEPFGKAGAYAIQGRAGGFIAHISGSYTGVMGLPLFETAQLLSRAGWFAL